MFKKLASAISYAVGWGKEVEDEFSDDDVGNEETDILINQIITDIYSKENGSECLSFKPPPQKVITSMYCNGRVTRLSPTDGVIDNKYFFDRRDAPNLQLDVGKLVTYHAFRHSEEQEWRVNKILTVHDEEWTDDANDADSFPNEGTEVEEEIISVNATNKRTIIGRVEQREGREIVVRDCMQLLQGGTRPRDTRFSLDNVNSDFVPMRGDIVSMNAHVEISDETVDGSGEVIEVISIAPCRARRAEGIVTKWNNRRRCGDISDDIYFHRDVCESGYIPKVNDEVTVEAIECEKFGGQGEKAYKWRALSVHPITVRQHFEEHERVSRKVYHAIDPELLKNKGNIVVQENTDFGRFPASGNYEIAILVSNEGESRRTITKHYIETRPSNLKLVSPLKSKIVIEPQDSITFVFKFNQHQLGYFSEVFVMECGDFQIGRLLKWEVFNESIPDISLGESKDDKFYQSARMDQVPSYMKVYDSRQLWVPGEKIVKSAAFVKVRLQNYPIPTDIRHAMTTGSDGDLCSRKNSRDTIKEMYPEVTQSLSSMNHRKMFHTLLYIAEMDGHIDMCRYTKQRVSFVRRGQASEYLALEMPGLAEGRPSLIVGDTVVAVNSWGANGAQLQGYVHRVAKNEVWFKFNPQFHNTYNSEDYDIYFQLGRNNFKKCHAALDFCHQFQANMWLFPKGVKARPPQIALEEHEDYSLPVSDADDTCYTNDVKGHGDTPKSVEEFFASFKASPQKSDSTLNGHIENSPKHVPSNVCEDEKKLKGKEKNSDVYSNRRKKLVWFNKRLNHRQKEAVRNILRGEARPLPYVIFGPPGTGKTMTLVETILQIYSLIKDSSVLVATPSNSSANLIAERLLSSGLLQPGDMVRLVANHLITEGKIPVELAPYCATIDISAGGHDKNEQGANGIATLGTKYIMRRRITIGTCIALGQLMHLGFPRGQYTHIVIDEAGQATEPEILIPLCFLAHETGQAVLAGDPLQLGPVVPSNLAGSFGLSKSLLARLLPRFPYQRDPTGFPDSGGYDPRLVTRLTANYRSLPDILELPSSLFYDSDLDPMVPEENSYEAKLLARATALLQFDFKAPSAVVFHGIDGPEVRENDSPSYFNPVELIWVYQYAMKLVEGGLKCDDIGIITPYQKQATKIRHMLERLGVTNEDGTSIKVGSVEEFQGQERMVIILSTVRSLNGDHIDTIGRNTAKQLLGFLNNPERLNVAISRARALLIICGNPKVLCVDQYWRSVVKYCVDRNSYMGIGVPTYLLDN